MRICELLYFVGGCRGCSRHRDFATVSLQSIDLYRRAMLLAMPNVAVTRFPDHSDYAVVVIPYAAASLLLGRWRLLMRTGGFLLCVRLAMEPGFDVRRLLLTM